MTIAGPRFHPLAVALAAALALSDAGQASPAPAAAGIATRRAEIADALRLPSPSGSTFVVTSCADSGPGTLRDAYFNAIDGETIDLSLLACSTISLESVLTDPPNASYVEIDGPATRTLTIDGGHHGRVLVHNGSGRLILRDVSIRGGAYSGIYGGGCVYSYGGLALQRTRIDDCTLTATGSANAYGGAVYAHDIVVAERSTISGSTVHSPSAASGGGAIFSNRVSVVGSTLRGNTASGDGNHHADGGAIFALGDLYVAYSTLADNHANRGGGIFTIGAAEFPMTIVDSTISGNAADGAGGGVYAKYHDLVVANSTIAQNRAYFPFGAGLYLGPSMPTATIDSTIVANNTSEDGLYASDIGGNASVAISGSNDLVIASTLPLPPDTISADPMLRPLADNGGLTPTQALMPGSPAIDAGSNPRALVCEQRAIDPASGALYPREADFVADIGAYESPSDEIFFDGFEIKMPTRPEDGPYCLSLPPD